MSTFPQLEHDDRNLLYYALDHTYECMVLTDAEGYILYMNKPYQEFLHVTDDVVGRHVTEVIENTRMHLVGQTGRAEIAHVQRIQGHDMIANRIPILRDGQVIAVIGTVMFQDVKQLYALAATVERLRPQVNDPKGEELRCKPRKSPISTTSFDDMVGVSDEIVALKKLAARVAKSETTVLITGESGTGKEVLARAIHSSSRRGMGPFVTVNCAAIPDTLLESELFGYEGGAFTGASPTGKRGKFELADCGTILLDEVGDMPLRLQAKLLRVLQEREVERIGGVQPIPVDVRIISSTHRDLGELINQGQFREDLFYRLNVVNLHIPPLRHRIQDIHPLTMLILGQLRGSTGVHVETIDEAAWAKLERHTWPGNVRELRNVLERALHLMDGSVLQAHHITYPFAEFASLSTRIAGAREAAEKGAVRPMSLKDSVAAAEKAAILHALSAAHGNRREAAKLLGISKSALYQRLAEYQL